MIHAFIHFLASFPPVVGTLLMAMLPMAERFALPVAIVEYHLPALQAFMLVIIGNMVPVVIILTLAEKFHAWLSRNATVVGKAWVKSLEHAQAKFAQYEKYGLLGLVLFLAIPSPLNGAFSGSLVAFILGYPRRRSFPAILLGIILGNSLALALTMGVKLI